VAGGPVAPALGSPVRARSPSCPPHRSVSDLSRAARWGSLAAQRIFPRELLASSPGAESRPLMRQARELVPAYAALGLRRANIRFEARPDFRLEARPV